MASFDAHDDRAQDADRTILLLGANKTPATPIAVIGMACRFPEASRRYGGHRYGLLFRVELRSTCSNDRLRQVWRWVKG